MGRLSLTLSFAISVLTLANAQSTTYVCPRHCNGGSSSSNCVFYGKCGTCSVNGECTGGSCLSGSYRDPTDKTCKLCPVKNCAQCNANTPATCTSCDTLYRLGNAQGTSCVAESEGCTGWSSTNYHCTSCKIGFGLSSSNVCGRCADNCLYCLKSGPGKCDYCPYGYYRTSGLTCEKCADNCVTCYISGTDKCDICETGYYLESNVCKKYDCKEGCLCNKNAPEECHACMKGYGWNFYGDDCRKCPPNCESCSSSTHMTSYGHKECDKCLPTYRKHSVTGRCYSSAGFIRASVFTALLGLLITKLAF